MGVSWHQPQFSPEKRLLVLLGLGPAAGKEVPHHTLLLRQQQSLAHRLSPCIFTAALVSLVGSRKDERRLMDV